MASRTRLLPCSLHRKDAFIFDAIVSLPRGPGPVRRNRAGFTAILNESGEVYRIVQLDSELERLLFTAQMNALGFVLQPRSGPSSQEPYGAVFGEWVPAQAREEPAEASGGRDR